MENLFVFWRKLNNENKKVAVLLQLFLIALLATLASEIRLVPFEGETFRFGLGGVAFFLLILIWPPASLIWTGIVTGVTVVGFRLFLDFSLYEIHISTSFINHCSAFLFYLLYALGLHIIKVEKYKTYPFILGAWASLFEFIGNSAEQLLRHLLLHQAFLGFTEWTIIIGVALLRSYFVVGLYASITVSEHKKRMQEIVKVGSELYGETLYLQKSMNHIEKITAESHDLYRKLRKTESHELSVQALLIAQEIHEVKKDSQRILSGLLKIAEQKIETIFFLSDVLNLVVHANENYSELLKKKIIIHRTITIDYETEQQIPLLALLNNLVANAVEAIDLKGEIYIEIKQDSANTSFIIEDSGKGIRKKDLPIIFEAGYTTKFNEEGVAATGIGLSHVQEIVQMLKGNIEIDTMEMGTVFRICIPTEMLRKRVE
ncbi:MAG TPA: ATP-binding protein [Bacillus bacterium]|nr:ATP-binding protein [Bacillus sp. (in: firmicutes)]